MQCESPPLLLTLYRAGIASIREELGAGICVLSRVGECGPEP